MESQDHNINLATCLQTVSDFGVNHIHNICSGVVRDVPWGSVDWLACFGISAFVGACTLMIAGMGIAIIRDSW